MADTATLPLTHHHVFDPIHGVCQRCGKQVEPSALDRIKELEDFAADYQVYVASLMRDVELLECQVRELRTTTWLGRRWRKLAEWVRSWGVPF